MCSHLEQPLELTTLGNSSAEMRTEGTEQGVVEKMITMIAVL